MAREAIPLERGLLRSSLTGNGTICERFESPWWSEADRIGRATALRSPGAAVPLVRWDYGARDAWRASGSPPCTGGSQTGLKRERWASGGEAARRRTTG